MNPFVKGSHEKEHLIISNIMTQVFKLHVRISISEGVHEEDTSQVFVQHFRLRSYILHPRDDLEWDCQRLDLTIGRGA